MTKSEYELLKNVINDLHNSDDEIEQLNRLFSEVNELLRNYERKVFSKQIRHDRAGNK